jgi:hypothetical protein
LKTGGTGPARDPQTGRQKAAPAAAEVMHEKTSRSYRKYTTGETEILFFSVKLPELPGGRLFGAGRAETGGGTGRAGVFRPA